MNKNSIIIIFLTLAGSSLQYTGWNIQSYPNPQFALAQCGRAGQKGTAICDPDSIITMKNRDKIDAILENILLTTRSPCDQRYGFKVVFTLMREIESMGWSYSKEQKAKAMAEGLHNRFGIGNYECNDGVLFLLSIEDRQMYISYGTGTY